MIARRKDLRRAIREQLIEIVEDEGKERLVLTEPDDWRFRYDYMLAIREALHRYRGGKPRLPEEVAATPPAWDDDVHLAATLLQFQRDAIG